MKSINVKIPLTVATELDDRAELNPMYLTEFLVTYLNCEEGAKQPITELSYNYTFKIDSELHKAVKLKAIEQDLPMNEFIGRLLNKYY